MSDKSFFQSKTGLFLSLLLCPPLAIYLLIRYDYMAKRWERVLGVVAGCYIAVVGFCVTATIETHAATLQAEAVAAYEAELVTVERELVPYVTDDFRNLASGR